MNIHLRKILPLTLLFILAFIVSLNYIHDNSILSNLFGVKSSNIIKRALNADFFKVDKKRLLQQVPNITNPVINTILSKTVKAIFDFPLSGATVKTYMCFLSFGLAQVKLGVIRKYPDWFDDDTTFYLYASGEYKGIDAITEYVSFAYNPDFELTDTTSEMYLLTDEITDDSTTCNITYVQEVIFKFTEDLFPPNTCVLGPQGFSSSFRLTGDSTYVTFEKINLYFSLEFMNALTYAPKEGAVAERVCGVMEESCEEVWAENDFANQTECQATIEAMPNSEGGGYTDGRSKFCRYAHGTYAPDNAKHCPHISTIPIEDQDGKIKCQESQNIQPSDIFSQLELDFIYDISMNELGHDESLIKACDD